MDIPSTGRKVAFPMLARTQVLTFHGIGEPEVPIPADEQRYFVPAETYRRTIAALAPLEKRYAVQLPVTFDDGNLSDYTIGLPALVDAGRTATFFVLAGRIGTNGYLSESQLRDIIAAGSQIETHGYDHVDWRKLDAAAYRRELYDARRKIEDVTGVAVTQAAVPFGAFDRNVLSHLKEAGYRRIYTSTSGLSLDGAWFCPRWSVTGAFRPDLDLKPCLAFRQKVRGTLFASLRRLRYRI